MATHHQNVNSEVLFFLTHVDLNSVFLWSLVPPNYFNWDIKSERKQSEIELRVVVHHLIRVVVIDLGLVHLNPLLVFVFHVVFELLFVLLLLVVERELREIEHDLSERRNPTES